MSKKNVTSDQNYIDELKDNYVRRVEEVDTFSKRLSTACADVNTEFLYGCLNTMQHCLDLQKKYSSHFPTWFFPGFIASMAKQNTEAWIQAIQNTDSVYIEGLKNMKNNLKALNKGSVLFIQSIERMYDVYQKTQRSDRKEELETQEHEIKLTSPKKEPTQA